ncbi:MAG: hypothetical protein AAGA78_01260 [Pseudomonadota bacterium]
MDTIVYKAIGGAWVLGLTLFVVFYFVSRNRSYDPNRQSHHDSSGEGSFWDLFTSDGCDGGDGGGGGD